MGLFGKLKNKGVPSPASKAEATRLKLEDAVKKTLDLFDFLNLDQATRADVVTNLVNRLNFSFFAIIRERDKALQEYKSENMRLKGYLQERGTQPAEETPPPTTTPEPPSPPSENKPENPDASK